VWFTRKRGPAPQVPRPPAPHEGFCRNMDCLLPLEQLRCGEWAEVADVSGEPGWVGRLAELGVRVGERVCMLQPGCPCLVQLQGSRLCLRGECAGCVLVRPVTRVA
jgi:ferrous iron transport protein A